MSLLMSLRGVLLVDYKLTSAGYCIAPAVRGNVSLMNRLRPPTSTGNIISSYMFITTSTFLPACLASSSTLEFSMFYSICQSEKKSLMRSFNPQNSGSNLARLMCIWILQTDKVQRCSFIGSVTPLGRIFMLS